MAGIFRLLFGEDPPWWAWTGLAAAAFVVMVATLLDGSYIWAGVNAACVLYFGFKALPSRGELGVRRRRRNREQRLARRRAARRR